MVHILDHLSYGITLITISFYLFIYFIILGFLVKRKGNIYIVCLSYTLIYNLFRKSKLAKYRHIYYHTIILFATVIDYLVIEESNIIHNTTQQNTILDLLIFDLLIVKLSYDSLLYRETIK